MKKFLSLVLALVMTMSLVTIGAGAKVFTDDSKITYVEAVDVLSALEIIGGYADGDFQPATTLTRGAAAKIICNLLLGPTTAEALGADKAPFKDVPASHTFAGYIAYCSSQGIINGYADGTFKPGATVTGFQFLKMLLGALGYDATIEKFVGGNWSVQVAKLAMSLKLTAGNDEFLGTKAMTREEACLYALNTLKADMVEYDTKGSNINLGTIGSITTGASKATKVVNAAVASTQPIVKDQIMQFAEQYSAKLKLTVNSDDFNRPANTWNYKTTKVGTYSKLPDLTYTAEVKLGDIYSDLGLGTALAASAVVYSANGASEATSGTDNSANVLTGLGLAKGAANKIGGNSVLTEVFFDTTTEIATITMVDTYAGEVTSKRAASGSNEATITVTPLNAGRGGNFETKDFAIDDIVLYTYSMNGSPAAGIQGVVKAETVTGTLTGYTAGKSATIGGTTYKYSKAFAATAKDISGAVKYEVKATLDTFGNIVDIDVTETSTNYAVILKYIDSDGWNKAKAQLLFTDGTTKDVTLTENYVAVADSGHTPAGKNAWSYEVVSYKINNKDQYTLTTLADTAISTTTSGKVITKGDSELNFVTGGATNNKSANGKTIFLVAAKNGSDTVYTSYTGIKNIPTLTVSAAVNYSIYCKSGTTATVVFVDATANSSLTTSTKDVIFVKGSDTVGSSYDSVKGTYYTYDAIVNGEITKIDSAAQINAYTLYSSVGYDANKVATLSGADGITAGNGTVRDSNGVIGLHGKFYSYANDCKVFYIDADKNITSSSVAGITTDATDNVWFKVTDGDVTTVVIQDVVSAAKTLLKATTTYAIDGVAQTAPNAGADDAVTGAVTIADGKVITVVPSVSTGASASVVVTGGTVDNEVVGATSYKMATGKTGTVIFTVTMTAENGTSATGTVTLTLS